ncbi:Flp family type IVb pilin [uncultured Acidaminococcus sp.]|uniref:Flp family type IVb pilin n=1 Tax=uncultured Acidaminococcus sp. TaxID=352152 RepID=UPI002589A7D9|nr:hypothetical protein [uncultured Acidaminococcus sp.]
MRRQKGQDIIEYALMLAIIVGIGGWIYNAGASGSLTRSINSVFSNASALLDEASKEKLPAASTAKDIIERLRQGRYDGLADVLQGKPSSTLVISSDSAAGQDLARKLNIQTKEGETEYPDQRGGRWFVDLHTDGQYVVTYYAADANKLSFSALKEDYKNNTSKYYNPTYGEKDIRRYPTKVTVDEGIYNSQGKERLYSGTTGHVGPSADGTGFTIYPGSY